MSLARWTRAAMAPLLLAFLAGCASTPPPPAPDASAPLWQGRLAVKVLGPQANSFASAFELQGNADQGQLELTSPLGSVLARIRWAPGSASLQTSGAPQQFANLDALTLQVVGTELPIAHLFDWLQGRPAAADGWQADLSAQESGRIVARRNSPLPEVDLRIALEK